MKKLFQKLRKLFTINGFKENMRGAVGTFRQHKRNLMKFLPHKHDWKLSCDSESKTYYWCYWCSKEVPGTYLDEKGHQKIKLPC